MRPDLVRQLELLPARKSGIVDRGANGWPGGQSRGKGAAEVHEQALGGEVKRKGQRRERKVERRQSRGQVHRARQEQKGEGGRQEKVVKQGKNGSPRGGVGAPLVEAPGNYEVDRCKTAANSNYGTDGAGVEFNSSGKTATLNDGEPLDLTAFNSPGGDAEPKQELSNPGERQELEDSTMAAIFKRAVEVLRKDGHLHSRRSNTELNQGPRCPPFPLRERSIIWLDVRAHWNPSPDEMAAPDSSPETSVRSLGEKRLSALIVRNRMWEVPDCSLSFSDFFLRRKVDYCGEEVKLAQSVTWAAVSESLRKV